MCFGAIARRCMRSQSELCVGFLCDICLHRSFQALPPRGNSSRSRTVSPILPLSSSARPFQHPSRVEYGMPCEAHYVRDCGEEVVLADQVEEVAAMQDAAPRTPTPKRAQQGGFTEVASPAKTLGAAAPPPPLQQPAVEPQCSTAAPQVPPQHAAPSVPLQPTNSDLLQYM